MYQQAEETNGYKCDLCLVPVSFLCRRCGVKLCDHCILVHLRVKSKSGHDVVAYDSKYVEDKCFCESHPNYDCFLFCNTCDVPICIMCISTKHKTHDVSELVNKVEELLERISRGNDRIQLLRYNLVKAFDNSTKQLFSLSSYYQKRTNKIASLGEDWHKLVDAHVRNLHQELEITKKENEEVLRKQKEIFEEKLKEIDEINRKISLVQKCKNVTKMQEVVTVIEQETTINEFVQLTFPIFHGYKPNIYYLQKYFGHIEKVPDKKISLLEKEVTPSAVPGRKMLDVPSVSLALDTEFSADRKNNRLYDMVATNEKLVWMGGHNKKLKSFDLQGNLQRTVTISCLGVYISLYKKQVIYSDYNDNTIKTIHDDDTVMKMFKTGEWVPLGITCCESSDLLVCLHKDDQSKVVRYSSTGTELQEIQYDSNSEPLYQVAWYITENVNADIIVADHKKKRIITVDSLGMLKFSYAGIESCFSPMKVVNNSICQIFVSDFHGNKVHMLAGDGNFLRYIIPEGGIKRPRALCMLSDGEIVVGECTTGLAKIIKFLE